MRKIVIPALCFALGWCSSSSRRAAPAAPVSLVCDTVVRVDTVRIAVPQLRRRSSLPPVRARMAVADSVADTVEVEVPRTLAVYQGDNYRAYVSGWLSSLDSIEVMMPQATVRVAAPARRQSRLSVGLQGGVGLTPAGFQPYIGVGVSVRLF